MKISKRTIAATTVAAAVLVPGAALAVGGFDDVPNNHTHADGIEWVANNGITSGCTATTYCPSDNLSRAQMATFLHRLSGHAPGVAPSVDAATVDGFTAAELMAGNGPAPAQPRDPFAYATGGSAFAHNGDWIDLPGATAQIEVPTGETAVLEIDFAAETACYGAAGYCQARILVNGVEAAPAAGTDFAFDSRNGGTETASSWESHSMTRIADPVPGGVHTVTLQVRTGGADFRVDDWSLTVDGHLV